MSSRKRTGKQAAALVRKALSQLQQSAGAAGVDPRATPALRKATGVLKRELRRLDSCRHEEDRAVWLSLRRASDAILDVIEEAVRKRRIYKLHLPGQVLAVWHWAATLDWFGSHEGWASLVSPKRPGYLRATSLS
jgi:hypothetical protein